MQIPESPPASALGRPETSLAEEESARNPSVSQDGAVSEIVTSVPAAQAEPSTANGASSDGQAGFASNGTKQVCYIWFSKAQLPADRLSALCRLGRVQRASFHD